MSWRVLMIEAPKFVVIAEGNGLTLKDVGGNTIIYRNVHEAGAAMRKAAAQDKPVSPPKFEQGFSQPE